MKLTLRPAVTYGQTGTVRFSNPDAVGIERMSRFSPASRRLEHPGLLLRISTAMGLPPAEQASAQFNGVGQAWSGVAAIGADAAGAGVG